MSKTNKPPKPPSPGDLVEPIRRHDGNVYLAAGCAKTLAAFAADIADKGGVFVAVSYRDRDCPCGQSFAAVSTVDGCRDRHCDVDHRTSPEQAADALASLIRTRRGIRIRRTWR